MRARTIKPGILSNEELAELGPFAYILLTALWMMADREGRLEDRPRRIWMKALALWGATPENVENLLKALAEKGFIRRYVVKGEKYIQIHNWTRHAHIHPRECQSTIPPYSTRKRVKQPLIQVSTFGMSTKKQHLGDTQAQPSQDPGTALQLPSKPFPSFPSLPSLGDAPEAGSSITTESVCTYTCASFDARVSVKNPRDEFEEFWKEHWRPEDKAGAQKAFAKFADTPERRAAILAAVRKQKPKMLGYEKDKRPYMSTWLNKRRFEDAEEPEELLPTARLPPRTSFDEMRDKAARETALKFGKGKIYGGRNDH